MKAEDYKRVRYGTEWFEHVSEAVASKAHDANVQACKAAWRDWQDPNRPMRVLVLHGSGRNKGQSCAHEESNSKLLLRTGLKALGADVEVEERELRQLQVEHCNGCVSTASTWCHFPCTCFPLDPMQELYPLFLRADVILMSTPVNQSNIASRLGTVISRLISLDGGIHIPEGEYFLKDEEHARKAITLEADGHFSYSPRLARKVCAYFITSKDQENPLGAEDDDTLDYATMLTNVLRSGMADYGCVHGDPWYVVAWAKHDEGYAFDKAHYSRETEAHDQAREVVRAAVAKAWEMRSSSWAPAFDRIDRT